MAVVGVLGTKEHIRAKSVEKGSHFTSRAMVSTRPFTASTLFWNAARSAGGQLELDDPLHAAGAEDTGTPT